MLVVTMGCDNDDDDNDDESGIGAIRCCVYNLSG